MENEKKELSIEEMDVSGGYREGLYLFRQDTEDEQLAYILKNARGDKEGGKVSYHECLEHWVTFTSKAQNSTLSSIDVTAAVKKGYGID